MKTKIYIVRHTETEGNVENRLTGKKDYEITEYGKILSNELTEELKSIKFDNIYSSTSGRTIKTIEQLAKLNNKKIIEIADLCEMDFGIYDGWKWSDVDKVQPQIRASKTGEISGIPGQESTSAVAKRMYNCIKKIAKENYGNTVLICSHGLAIEAFLRMIANVPFKYKSEKFCQHNVAINEVEFENNKFSILQCANVEYLNISCNKI